ncbi:hypothetical protein QN277_015425 [Acacia crassicarpa]|uniref:Syntaxin 6/10/61 N-terminal domain-containing protein n=1 Tax=Acacia crassicarpa TaxID=499986 RepID=A0AAE1K0P1_9FABA|nr:hypothetical protein QN277_015425 [Acacia crassicarpa]
MASSFDRWEKDPFFTAAEEVQESADRMESTYRTWTHAKNDASSSWDSEELRRDLQTSLGTAKWQLEEFERAVNTSYGKISSDEARNRHHDFIAAIQENVRKVEKSLQESTVSDGKAPLPWLRLNEGERNELALFLSGTPKKSKGRDNECKQLSDKDSGSISKNPLSSEWKPSETKEQSSHGHRRIASASADFSSWKIAVSDDVQPYSSSNGSSGLVHKVPSFSGFFNSMESVPEIKWPKNAFRKLKALDNNQGADGALLPSSELNRGISVCYERSKSYLDSDDKCYDKQLYGWYGAIQRQLQRSQYLMQYSRPVLIVFWMVLSLSLIVLVAFRAV